MPAIIRFLGYDPFPPANTLAEKLLLCRKTLGLSQEKLAKKLGVDESTLADWEAEKHRPTRRSLKLIEAFFKRYCPHLDLVNIE